MGTSVLPGSAACAREKAPVSTQDSFTLLLTPPESNRQLPAFRRKPSREAHCYHLIKMKPQSIGRALGIGLRVAGRMAGQAVAGATQAAESKPAPSAAAAADQNRPAGRTRSQRASQASHGIAQGLRGFLRPFSRVGGILWLEVTGVFFFLPVVVFGPTVWRTRLSWAHGPDHRTFLVAAGVVVLFLYLSVTSFWRARRK